MQASQAVFPLFFRGIVHTADAVYNGAYAPTVSRIKVLQNRPLCLCSLALNPHASPQSHKSLTASILPYLVICFSSSYPRQTSTAVSPSGRFIYMGLLSLSIRIYGIYMRDSDLAGEVGRGLLILFLLKSSDDQEGKRSRCAHSCAARREVYNGNIRAHCKLRRRTPPHNGCARSAALPPLCSLSPA